MKIEYYSKLNCIWCDKLKSFLDINGLQYNRYVLDVDFTREEILSKAPSATTFPVVFVNDKFIGGYTQFVDWYNKKELEN